MCDRKRHYDVGVLTVIDTDYKNYLENLTISIEDETDEGAGIGFTTTLPELTKTKSSLEFTTKLRNGTGKRYNMLTLTVFTLAGDMVAICESGSIEFTTTSEDDSGGAAQHECDNPGRTTMSFSGTFKIIDSALLMEAMSETVDYDSVRLVDMSLTIGGITITTLPVRISKNVHSVMDDKAQTQELSGTNYGSYTTSDITSDNSILVAIATGNGIASFSLDTGANTYTNTEGALITKATFNFENRKLNSLAVSMNVRGGFDTITAAA